MPQGGAKRSGCQSPARRSRDAADSRQARLGPAAPYARQRAERAFALDPVATLKVEQLIGELKERYTIVIVTDNLQQATPAAYAPAFMRDGELVERGSTTGMLADPNGEYLERDVSGKVG